MNEFKVNDYITLKLEKDSTNIYINGKFFNHCKFLLLDIPVDDVKSFNEIESIDDAADKLERSLESPKNRIPPKTEFWGHCSNLQVWFENNYDTRLLHRTIAFPMLKKLSEAGDPIAKRVFKEEIAKRFLSGNSTVITYLINERYLNVFNKEELDVIQDFNINNFIGDPIFLLENIYIRSDFKRIIARKIIENGHINKLLLDKYLDFLPDSIINTNTEIITSFRKAKIPLKEAMALRDFEKKINNGGNTFVFELVDDFNFNDNFLDNNDEYGTQFIVNNNRIIGISINDPNYCEACGDYVRKGDMEKPSYEECRNCGFRTLPDTIGNFEQLRELYIETDTFHGFKELPDSIGNLKNLKKLVLQYNRLESLPDSIGNLSSLEELILYGVRLNSLPESIGDLKSLKILRIEGDQHESSIEHKLKMLPESIGNLKALQTLTLKNHHLKILPESLLKLKKLKNIHINYKHLIENHQILKKLEEKKVEIRAF